MDVERGDSLIMGKGIVTADLGDGQYVVVIEKNIGGAVDEFRRIEEAIERLSQRVNEKQIEIENENTFEPEPDPEPPPAPDPEPEPDPDPEPEEEDPEEEEGEDPPISSTISGNVQSGVWDILVDAVDDYGECYVREGYILYFDIANNPPVSRRTSGEKYAIAEEDGNWGLIKRIKVRII